VPHELWSLIVLTWYIDRSRSDVTFSTVGSGVGRISETPNDQSQCPIITDDEMLHTFVCQLCVPTIQVLAILCEYQMNNRPENYQFLFHIL